LEVDDHPQRVPRSVMGSSLVRAAKSSRPDLTVNVSLSADLPDYEAFSRGAMLSRGFRESARAARRLGCAIG
jgi:hypothetical protein